MKSKVVNWFKALLGFTTHINWDGKKYTHYSWTRKGAYEWMKCYPVEGAAWITHSAGAFIVAGRNLTAKLVGGQ